jgi:3-dehydroquinate synthase
MIETASGYRIAHGESVAIDIALSSHVARLTGRLDDADCARIVRLLRKLGLPTFDPQTCTVATLDAALTSAWRRRGRRLHLVVPSGIGAGVFLDDLDSVPQQVLAEAVSALAAEHGEALPRRCGR